YELLASMGLQLLDHPMDYRIVREGDYYVDPSLPEGSITWQYAVVPKDFDFPDGIRCEILDECYIAENAPASKSAEDIDWAAVELESYRLTGNSGLIVPSSRAEVSAVPQGSIRIIDSEYSDEPIGVRGVMVCCNTFVKIGTAYTDDDGHYEMNRGFSSELRYRVIFKNEKGFSQGLNLILAPSSISTLGPAGPEGVSIVADATNRSFFCRCAINNAVRDYYDSCSGSGGESILPPPANLRIWTFQLLNLSSAVMLQQGCMLGHEKIQSWLGNYASLVKIFLPDITIGLRGSESYKSIYASAVHECAHASHFCKAGISYWDVLIQYIAETFLTSGGRTYGSGSEESSGYCAVAETWAYFVESVMVQERYGSQNVYGTSFWFHPQILLYLHDRGLTRYKIFKALDSGVTDMETLNDRLIYYYPEFKSMINQAFLRYE
ncbi:MAG: hypothetical protein J5764_06780, partial [Bacteroidales bacterium]|nr:hypothetical protein [Bacteroidales bacterium]